MSDNNLINNLMKELLSEINQIDFTVLKENYNRLLFRSQRHQIDYENDEYSDISFFNKEMFGDDFFLKNELLKQVEQTVKGLMNAPYDQARKLDILFDEFDVLIGAIGISHSLNPDTYLMRLRKKIKEV